MLVITRARGRRCRRQGSAALAVARSSPSPAGSGSRTHLLSGRLHGKRSLPRRFRACFRYAGRTGRIRPSYRYDSHRLTSTPTFEPGADCSAVERPGYRTCRRGLPLARRWIYDRVGARDARRPADSVATADAHLADAQLEPIRAPAPVRAGSADRSMRSDGDRPCFDGSKTHADADPQALRWPVAAAPEATATTAYPTTSVSSTPPPSAAPPSEPSNRPRPGE